MLAQKIKGKLNQYRPRKIAQRVDEMLSRAVLGHGAGYSSHLQGKKCVEQGLKWQGSSKEAEQFRKQGFALIPPYSDSLIKEIQAEWAAVIEDDEKSAWGGPVTRQIKDPAKNFPILKKLITEDVLNHFRAYYGTEVKINSALCWRNYDPQEKRGEHVFSNWWHFDATNTAVAKLFVALSDITEDHGPFHIYTIQASKDLVKKGYKDRRHYGNAPVETHEGLYKMVGPAGTAVICNTEICLHKAGEPTNGNFRDMIQFQIVPSSEAFDENWLDNIAKKGVDLDKNSGNMMKM